MNSKNIRPLRKNKLYCSKIYIFLFLYFILKMFNFQTTIKQNQHKSSFTKVLTLKKRFHRKQTSHENY